MRHINAFSDPIRAIATYVALMLLWPMAVTAGLSVSGADSVPICTAWGVQNVESQSEQDSAQATNNCIYCYASVQQALDVPTPFVFAALPPARLPVFVADGASFSNGFSFVFSARGPPAFV